MVFDALVENRVEWPETPVFGEGAKDNTRGRVCSPWMLRLLTICHFKLLLTRLPGKPPELMNPVEKQQCYEHARSNILALIAGETDEIAVLASVAAELYHAFPHFHWVGFYRVVSPRLLKVGPYQGGHGCLTIPFDRGVCGRCASEKTTQIVADVTKLPYHIACSGTTLSEIVIPIFDNSGEVRAVLDVDSDFPDIFDAVDQAALELLADDVSIVFSGKSHH